MMNKQKNPYAKWHPHGVATQFTLLLELVIGLQIQSDTAISNILKFERHPRFQHYARDGCWRSKNNN